MAKKTSSFERFWKELKRRKVIRVITVYAAIAFVILQLVDIVSQPLLFPEWTQGFIIVLLCIGFVIAVFLSWIYDITPAGVKKTKPVSAIKHTDQATHAVTSGWKIATYVSVVIIVALVTFNIVTRKNLTGDRTRSEKSIAVLPFQLLSDEPDKQYLADGIMDAITLHLSKIKDLRVIGKTSVEQYRNPTKTTTAIGKELDVEFLLEGSFQKFGDNVKLIVQLIKTGKEGHVWANEYDRNWSDIFAVQSEVAQAVAAELYASITQEEKKLIEKKPTSSMAALDLYLKANDFLKEYEKTRDLSPYQTAVNLYNAALSIDTAYAKAYTGLASAYYDRYQWETYFKENYLDSMLVLIDKALDIDDQLDEAYYLKGRYYQENGHIKDALDNYDKTLKINPNHYLAYQSKGDIYSRVLGDYVNGLGNYHKALTLVRGKERPALLGSLGGRYMEIGFTDKAKYYYQEAFEQDSNKSLHFRRLAWIEFSLENFEETLKLVKQGCEIDSLSCINAELMFFNVPSGHKEEAYLFAKKKIENYKRIGTIALQTAFQIGYAFWQVGQYQEAKDYFNQQIKYDEESIRLRRPISQVGNAQYDLASTYAFLGEKTKAYKYLEEFVSMYFPKLWQISYAKHNPFMKSISNEERYKKSLQNMEAKYQAEHERVRKWLEEQGML